MPPTEATQTDSASGVVPDPRPKAPWRVVHVSTREGMRLEVRFADGTTGEVLLEEFLEGPLVAGTVFEALRNPTMFSRAHVEMGVVTWPNGADLAPDAMYDAIQAEGRWLVPA